MTIRLLEAKLDDLIDEKTYRRLVIMTGASFYSDLCYMKDDINNDNFPITSDEQEGLLGNGWIRPLGPGFGEIDTGESSNLFAYNQFAKMFCKIVFNSAIDVLPPSDKGVLKIATDDDMNGMFEDS